MQISISTNQTSLSLIKLSIPLFSTLNQKKTSRNRVEKSLNKKKIVENCLLYTQYVYILMHVVAVNCFGTFFSTFFVLLVLQFIFNLAAHVQLSRFFFLLLTKRVRKKFLLLHWFLVKSENFNESIRIKCAPNRLQFKIVR